MRPFFLQKAQQQNKPVRGWIGAAAQSSKEKEEIGWVCLEKEVEKGEEKRDA